MRHDMRHNFLAAGLVLAFVTAGSVAHAGPVERSKALFDQGRDALEAGKVDEACGHFGESQRLDPHVGTLLNWALCEEKRGRWATALARWNEAVELADKTGDDRGGVARERADKVTPRVPQLTLSLASDAPADAHVSIARAGEEPRAASLGEPMRLDPASYRVRVEAPGRAARDYDVALDDGARRQLEVAPGAPIGLDAPPPEPPDEASAGGFGGLGIAGFVVGGLGLVSLGIGGGFGGIAIDKQGKADDPDATGVAHCSADNRCDAEGLALRDDAITAATVSTALIVAGGVLTAAGITMVIVDASGDTTETAGLGLRLGPSQLSLEGSF